MLDNDYSLEDRYRMNLQDSYTIFYAYLVKGLLDDFGLKGERAAREGIRRFGRDRGITRRDQHIEYGYKINMKNLFSVGGDLPNDPRFKRDLQEINPQERISHTLVCPMSDVWKEIGMKDIGRMYCEEFHFACYNSYAYGYTQVNLARTLTQEEDDYCSFSVILRPENLSEDLKKQCFSEYDPLYKEPISKPEVANAKDGFKSLCIRIYYHILDASVEILGQEGAASVEKSLRRLAKDSLERMKKSAYELGQVCDKDFIRNNYPVNIEGEELLWEKYNSNHAQKIMEENFCNVFLEELKLSYD